MATTKAEVIRRLIAARRLRHSVAGHASSADGASHARRARHTLALEACSCPGSRTWGVPYAEPPRGAPVATRGQALRAYSRKC